MTNCAKLNVKTIFLDIDTTLVDHKPGIKEESDTHSRILAELVAEKNGVSFHVAQKRIHEIEASAGKLAGNEWPFGLQKLKVSRTELWAALSSDAQNRLFMHEDAKKFLAGMVAFPSIKIIAATTNPRMAILAKLSVGGLGGLHGSQHLHFAFGGEEVHPGGKSTPEFYKVLAKRFEADPKTTLMVGDHPVMDLQLAKSAGIAHVALVRRSQLVELINEDDGGVYIKSLDLLLQLLVND